VAGESVEVEVQMDHGDGWPLSGSEKRCRKGRGSLSPRPTARIVVGVVSSFLAENDRRMCSMLAATVTPSPMAH
jgi:hypothetical protein